jgi:hypothetical protein
VRSACSSPSPHCHIKRILLLLVQVELNPAVIPAVTAYLQQPHVLVIEIYIQIPATTCLICCHRPLAAAVIPAITAYLQQPHVLVNSALYAVIANAPHVCVGRQPQRHTVGTDGSSDGLHHLQHKPADVKRQQHFVTS